MKRILFVITLVVLTLNLKVTAQPGTKNTNLLTCYFDLKNAFVHGNAKDASVRASQMIKALNTGAKLSDAKVQDKILEDVSHISVSKDISHQREHFARLSKNMLIAVKELKLNTGTIYYDYCPMLKSYWLTNETAIKNPYYGKQMLTCGSISETIK